MQLLKIGDRVRTRKGKSHYIEKSLGIGGQGEVFRARGPDGDSIIKLFHRDHTNEATRIRTKYLIDQQLSHLSPTLFPPTDLVDTGTMLGHVASIAQGESMESLISSASFNFMEGLQIGAAHAHAYSVLHDQGIAHGDPSANNATVFKNGHCAVGLIDFDNFVSSKARLPLSPCLGQEWYMAPEVRYHKSQPSVKSDCFGLAITLHELILLRHPAPVPDGPMFDQVMGNGIWLDSPARRDTRQLVNGGYPPEILDTELCRMFKAGLSPRPDDRPSARQWYDALRQTMYKIFMCPYCGHPNVIDSSKTFCPTCRRAYPQLALQTCHAKIVLDRASTAIGRRELGGSAAVSGCHAVIYRVGPEYRLSDRSTNGVFRLFNEGWVPLKRGLEPSSCPLIQDGDRLRFADVDVLVKSV